MGMRAGGLASVWELSTASRERTRCRRRTPSGTPHRWEGGLREPVEFMSLCSTERAVYLLGLKASLEGGKGNPWPDKAKISSWE
jgi:hypothetical protein